MFVEQFSWGIDLRKKDVDKVINELLQIREWSLHNLSKEKLEHILIRSDLLITTNCISTRKYCGFHWLSDLLSFN